MRNNTIKLYNGKAFGETVSEYGLEHGYLDYYTLAKLVGNRILNNDIFTATGCYDWEVVNGCDYDEEEDIYHDVFQYYIISESGYRFLSEYTDEIVYYNEDLDMYLWGITHFGTSWDYVLTDVKIVE